jgi:hypothetical protein
VETAEDFAQEFEDGAEEDGDVGLIGREDA